MTQRSSECRKDATAGPSLGLLILCVKVVSHSQYCQRRVEQQSGSGSRLLCSSTTGWRSQPVFNYDFDVTVSWLVHADSS